MSRTSKLDEKQWEEVSRRVFSGESVRSVAKKFGLSDTAIRKRGIPLQHDNLRTLAKTLVDTEKTIEALPKVEKTLVYKFADRLKCITDNLAEAAEYGAKNSNRLSKMAHTKILTIKNNPDEDDYDELKNVAALTKMAKEASDIGINLLKANQSATDNALLEIPEGLEITTTDSIQAAREYQKLISGS